MNAEVEKGVRRGRKPRPAGHPNYNNYNRTSAPNAVTEPGAPRQRADALGAPSMETGQGLSNGHTLAAAAELEPPTPTPQRPFPEVDAKIRTLLAEPRLFAGSRTMEFDERSILICCPTDGMAAALRPFADDIADGLGVEQVRFSVSHGPGLRKMQ